jgi:hypothetical protein
MILPAAIGLAADAEPELGIFDGIVRPVVAFDPDDLAVHDIDFEETPPTAVVRRAPGADHFDFGRRFLEEGARRGGRG